MIHVSVLLTGKWGDTDRALVILFLHERTILTSSDTVCAFNIIISNARLATSFASLPGCFSKLKREIFLDWFLGVAKETLRVRWDQRLESKEGTIYVVIREPWDDILLQCYDWTGGDWMWVAVMVPGWVRRIICAPESTESTGNSDLGLTASNIEKESTQERRDMSKAVKILTVLVWCFCEGKLTPMPRIRGHEQPSFSKTNYFRTIPFI